MSCPTSLRRAPARPNFPLNPGPQNPMTQEHDRSYGRGTLRHKSSGLSPVCFAMRANIRGPISSSSWNAKT